MQGKGIVWIDMHIRDQRVFSWMKEQADEHGRIPVRYSDIAQEFGCHLNTALAILHRLVGAGLIEVDRTGGKRGGYSYKVKM